MYTSNTSPAPAAAPASSSLGAAGTAMGPGSLAPCILPERMLHALAIAGLFAGTPGRMSIAEVARELGLPVRRVTVILADLNRAQLVRASVGRDGGFELTRQPAQITLLEVARAVDVGSGMLRAPWYGQAPAWIRTLVTDMDTRFEEWLAHGTLADWQLKS
jgi:DNA-binding IscR family transcriptional regulator